MATFLDVGILSFFVPLFSFIFIFTILYAILQKTKMLGGKSGIDFIVSLFVTILVVLNTQALELANFMSVWAVVVLVILVFLFILFFSWAKEGELGLPPRDELDLQSILFWVFVIILAIGLTQVFGPVLTPYAEGAPTDWVVLRTLFHPRLLGALIILFIVGSLSKFIKAK